MESNVFLKLGERKCSDSSVVRGQISGLLRLVSKLSDITYTCLALDLAITARTGHFTDSVCKNLAAVEKGVDSAESHRRVFNMFLPHFYMQIPFLLMIKTILKLRTLALFLKRNFKNYEQREKSLFFSVRTFRTFTVHYRIYPCDHVSKPYWRISLSSTY